MGLEYLLSKIIKKLHLRAIKSSSIHKTSKVEAGSHLINVQMGKYSFVGYSCEIINTKIGAFCSLGSDVVIGGASHTIDWVSTSPVFNENPDSIKKKFSKHTYKPFSTNTVGNDVWIGSNVMIKAGVSIGDGAVVGMGSIVTKDIPPYEIWAGNPAKLIRKRFDDATIAKLEEIKWWDFDDQKLSNYASTFNNVEAFIEKVKG